jgi:hypothetical protein
MSQASCRSTVLSANASTQVLNAIGPNSGSATGGANEGILHTISIASSTTAGQVTVRDGGSGDTIVAAVGVAANQGACFILDLQLLKGMYVTLASFTSPQVTLTYR